MEKILLISRLVVKANFLEKGKVSDYSRDQRRRNHPGKGMPTPDNHGAGSVAPRVPLRAKTGHPALSSLHAVELYPGQDIYSLPQIYPSWTELEVLSLKKD